MEQSVQEAFSESIRLWASVEWQDQGSRAGAIKIFGKPPMAGENLRNVVKDIGIKLNIQIEDKHIAKCHRVKAHNNGTAILCLFNDDEIMRKVMKEKKELSKDPTTRNIKIFESLTGARSAVMRKLNSNPAVAKIWTSGGKLKVVLRKAALTVPDPQRADRCMERSENDTEVIMTVGHFDQLWKLASVGFEAGYISDLMDCAKRGRDEY